jgi:urease accessory protein
VADGGTFDWHLQPFVATAGCRHHQDVAVLLEGSGVLRWTEELLLGRWEESPGRLDLRLEVDLDGDPLLRHQLRVGPDADGWDGPAVLGGHRAVGLALHAGRGIEAAEPAAGPGWAALTLEGPAVMVVALADDLVDVRTALANAALGIVTSRCPS